MLTTIPEELYENTCKNIAENDGLRFGGFDWDEMLKNASTIKTVTSYMKQANCQKLGAGSGRIAYLVKPGFIAGENQKVDGVACFKVAKNMKGVAQNKEETKYLTDLEEYSFAPILYNADEAGLFVLVEAGTPVKNKWNKKVINYFKDWNDWAFDNGFVDLGEDNNVNVSINNAPGHSPNDNFFDGFLSDLYFDADSENRKAVFEELGEMVRDFPKYKPIYDFVNWLYEDNAFHNLEVLDFVEASNWAFVKRDNQEVLIPIDFGFTTEVREKYYA